MPSSPAPERLSLPIDALLGDLRRAVAGGGVCVVQAEPGAGKTTRIPVALLEDLPPAGEVWVVEPRRMAAVLAARYVAQSRGECCGETVGYSVRFDECAGPRTRVRYVTDGIFLRRLIQDPLLPGIAAVVFDELHERRLAMDLGLAAVRRLRATVRPDLWLLAMSATLEVPQLAAWLGDCPVLQVAGRQFPVVVEHAPTLDQRPLPDQVASAVRRLLAEGLDGDILCFLPGALEIRRCADALAGLASDHQLALRPLHGALPLAEQEAALAPERRRKVVLATNIAETSVTLPGVVAVVDSGLARVAGYAPWSGLPTLQLGKISRASATQRAGRAGRVRAGRCLRLYTQFDAEARPGFDRPEILRADLCDAWLQASTLAQRLGTRLDADFWLTPPDPALIASAVQTLERLGALRDGSPTERAQQLLRLPVHPRLACLLLEGRRLGIPALVVRVAAWLSDGGARGGQGAHPSRPAHGESDLWALLEAEDAVQFGSHPQEFGLSHVVIQQVQRARRQLERLVPGADRPGLDLDSSLGMALLAAFGDRLARRRQPGQPELEMPGGSRLALGPRSQVTEAAFVVVLDAEERRDGRGASTQVSQAHGVSAELILEALGERVLTDKTLGLERQRVVETERLSIDGLELDRTVRPAQPSPEVAEVLIQGWLARGIAQLVDPEALAQLTRRVQFVRDQGGGPDLPVVDADALQAALREAATGCTRMDEINGPGLLHALQMRVADASGGKGLRLLDEWAPVWMLLPGGRRLQVHYEEAQPPWVQSRLQDFFGLADGPRVALGRVPLVLHLLAPNQRPVQVTTDLAGFWARHYPALRRELGRRYPRHSWPEDPLSAEPPPPHRPR